MRSARGCKRPRIIGVANGTPAAPQDQHLVGDHRQRNARPALCVKYFAAEAADDADRVALADADELSQEARRLEKYATNDDLAIVFEAHLDGRERLAGVPR